MTDNDTVACYEAKIPDWYGLTFCGLLPLGLLLFGITGMIYSRRQLKSNHSKLVQYLLFLYNWDALLLISTFGFYGIASLFSSPIGKKPTHGIYVYFYLVFYPLVNLSMTGSMWTIVVISIERFIALSQPLRHHSRDTNRFAIIVRASVTVGSVFINIPKLLELSTLQCWDGEAMSPQIAPSNLRLNPHYQLFYSVICNAIFVCPLPFAIICVLTIKTWVIRRGVLRAQESRHSFRNRTGKDKTTFLLLAMIAKFLLCQSCPTVLNVLELCMGGVRNTRWFGYLIDMSNFLVILNSATNWLVFSHLPKKQPTAKEQSPSNNNSSYANMQQYEALKHIWPKDKHEQLGIELLQVGMTANPALREKLAQIYCVEVFDESAHADHVSHHGQNIGGILDRMFSLALSGESFDRAAVEIVRAARAHASHKVVLRNADWIVVKRYLLDRLFKELDDDQKQLANQLVSMVVSELKHGFAYGSITPSPKLPPRGLSASQTGSHFSDPGARRKNKSVCVVSLSERAEEQVPLLTRHATLDLSDCRRNVADSIAESDSSVY